MFDMDTSQVYFFNDATYTAYFPAFGLIYSVNNCIKSECGKKGTRNSPNMDNFYAV